MGDYSGLSRRAQCSPRVLIRKRRRQKDREIEREGERLEDVNTAGFEDRKRVPDPRNLVASRR